MKLKRVRTIYLKEMRETLRDRRTLISMILIPLLLFPVLMLGMSSLMIVMVKRTAEEKSKLVLIGGEHAPTLRSWLTQGDKFELVEEKDFKSALREKKISVALEFSSAFEEKVKAEDSSEVTIYFDAAELKSEMSAEKLKDKIQEYQDSMVTTRLDKRQIDRSLLNPVKIKKENVASKEKMGGAILAMFLPYMVIILAMTGAMYPAMDLTAGEKERGTLETILVSPVSRLEIAWGKFLTVLTASVITAFLAIASMTFTTSMGFGGWKKLAGEEVQLSINLISILVLLLMIFPISALFSSLLLSISLFARTYKEAQSYVTPLMFVVILPAMVSFLPGIELNPALAIIPIVNLSLALKEVLTGTFRWSYIILIFLSTAIYASFSVFITKQLFEKEQVLFKT